jgi:hypothetical protein
VVYQDITTGKYKKSQSDGTSSEAGIVGVVTQDGGITNNSTGEVTLEGLVENLSWSWTPGKTLYLSGTAGSLTETEPTTSGHYYVVAGHSVTATQIWFQPEMGWQIGVGAGTTGPTGPTGSQGVQGYQGTQGYQGVTGTQGSQGVQGSTGPQGTQGYQGVTGSQGPSGGPLGPTGPTGPAPITGTAGESLSQYDVVYQDSSDSGKFKKAQCDGTALEADAVGVVTQGGGITSGSTGEITLFGLVTNGSWTWTPGKSLYISATAGVLTETAPTTTGQYIKPVGYAITATQIMFQPQSGWKIASGNTYLVTDIQSNRPSAGVQGRIFKPTDGYYESYDNGSSWDIYINGFKCSNPPAATTFTKVTGNANISTLTDESDGLMLQVTGSGNTSNNPTAFIKAVPSSPYVMTIGFSAQWFLHNNVLFGLCLANGNASSSSVINFWIGYAGSNYMYSQKLSTYTTWNSDYLSMPLPSSFLSGPVFLRIRDNGTTRYLEYSMNGRVWDLFHSVGRTDYMTPTYCGIWAGADVTNVSTSLTRIRSKIFHWYLG